MYYLFLVFSLEESLPFFVIILFAANRAVLRINSLYEEYSSIFDAVLSRSSSSSLTLMLIDIVLFIIL